MHKSARASLTGGVVLSVRNVLWDVCTTYPWQVVFELNGRQAHMLQFVYLLFESVIKLLHHHQAFIRPRSSLGRHSGETQTSVSVSWWLLQKKHILEGLLFSFMIFSFVNITDVRWMISLIIMERLHHLLLSKRLKRCHFAKTGQLTIIQSKHFFKSRWECRRPNFPLPFLSLIHLSSHHSSVSIPRLPRAPSHSNQWPDVQLITDGRSLQEFCV